MKTDPKVAEYMSRMGKKSWAARKKKYGPKYLGRIRREAVMAKKNSSTV